MLSKISLVEIGLSYWVIPEEAGAAEELFCIVPAGAELTELAEVEEATVVVVFTSSPFKFPR
jgi:hypothetical protein